MRIRLLPTAAALAFSLLALPAPADSTKKPAPAPSSSVPAPAAASALLPDLEASFGPGPPDAWPTSFQIHNVGHSKSMDTYVRIGVFVKGEDSVTKKSCLPRYAGFDKLVKGLNPGEMTLLTPVGPDPAHIKYMPTPPVQSPAIRGGMIACSFQVGVTIANNGKNDPNPKNDEVIRDFTVQMHVVP